MSPRGSNFHNAGMQTVNPYKARIQAWVQEICDDLGITYTELARRAGIDSATLTRFMNNPKYKPNLSNTTVQKIAEAVLRPTPDLPSPLTRLTDTKTVPVKGTAAAGLWKDVSILADEFFVHEEIPVIENPKYAGHKQYALLVEGNSINKKIRDGEYAICVEWFGLGAEPRDGQYVHVERSRGGLQEVTIKQVRLSHGKVELWPDSTDPRYQEPMHVYHSDEDTEVRIRGLVIGTFRHFT
jgi:phage repressor protein C with HTH and peptisase S24 domain